MTEHPQPPPLDPPQPATTKANRYDYAPMQGRRNLLSILETLLKHPGSIIWEINGGRAASIAFALALIMVFSLGIYGVVVGSLIGGSQLWIAPVKIIVGSLLSVLICLPSLYIFLCLSGASVHLRQVAGMLIASSSLTALLLISFAPVAWVFSQSTDSIGLMGFLHLLFWTVALWFGLGLLAKCASLADPSAKGNLSVWMVIYIVVSLQMMTTIRPIIGHAETFLPMQKQFFLTHWLETAGKNVR